MFELQQNHSETVKNIFFIPQERKDTFRQVSGSDSIVGTANQIKATTIHHSLIGQGLCCYSTHGLPEFQFYNNLNDKDYKTWKESLPVKQMIDIRRNLQFFCDKCTCLFNSNYKMGFTNEDQVTGICTFNYSLVKLPQ